MQSPPTAAAAARPAAPAALPRWMRIALVATAVMNAVAGLAFLPPARGLRALTGFPDGEPVYLATVALFVLLFGAGYLAVGIAGRPERLFVALAAAGKLGFVTLVAGYWLAGRLPAQAFVTALGDLPFGALFAWWLWTTRVPVTGRRASSPA